MKSSPTIQFKSSFCGLIYNYKLSFLFLSFLFFSCNNNPSGEGEESSFWEQFEIIGHYELVGSDSVLICDLSKLKQKATLPISLIVEDMDMILLDEADEDALISFRLAKPYITDNYVAVAMEGFSPLKLFDKEGGFLRHIGAIGEGPGEYMVIGDVYMDEYNNRIYILPFTTKEIIVYDFEGNLYSSIPLVKFVYSGNSFIVDTNKEEILMTQPISPGNEYVLWVQDFGGNVKQGVYMNDYYKDIYYTSETTMTGFRTSEVEYYNLYMENENMYFYHYDLTENRLKPVFKVQNPGSFSYILIHELPHQYIIEETKNMGFNNDISPTSKVIIDKKTMRGFYFGGFELPSGLVFNDYGLPFRMKGSYFSILDFGSEILSKINTVNISKLSEPQKRELNDFKKLLESKSENDDTSWLIYGSFKQ